MKRELDIDCYVGYSNEFMVSLVKEATEDLYKDVKRDNITKMKKSEPDYRKFERFNKDRFKRNR